MLKEIMKNTIEYVNSFPKKERKSYGQFFTPIQTAEYMASLIRTESEKVKILDPGAGNGLLTAAVVEHLIARGTAREISVVLYENDKNIQSLLKKNIEIISSYCSQKQVKLFIKTQKENFIVDNQKYWEMQKSKGLFDIVISNPPYLKIRKEAAESVCMSEIVHGQPNMYFLFMAMAVKMLRTNGEFVFITPRSWTSGTYFKSFRSYFMDSMDIQRVHLFESRNSVFKGKEGHSDDILQETMITYGKKSKSQSRNIIIAISQNAQDLGKVKEIQVESGNCLPEGKEHYFVLPSDEEDLKVLNYMKKMPNTVEEAGFRFKTGQVVEFRNKEYIAWEKKESTIPLLHSCNVLEGRIVFPVQTEKPQYFVVKDESKKNVMENQNTVFLKRATAKEEKRRLQPALHLADAFAYKQFTAENHLNYLVKVGERISLCEVYGFYTLLSSDIWERYYRMLNGSTQVNSAELNTMPIPAKDVLQKIGKTAMREWKKQGDYFTRDNMLSSDEILRQCIG